MRTKLCSCVNSSILFPPCRSFSCKDLQLDLLCLCSQELPSFSFQTKTLTASASTQPPPSRWMVEGVELCLFMFQCVFVRLPRRKGHAARAAGGERGGRDGTRSSTCRSLLTLRLSVKITVACSRKQVEDLLEKWKATKARPNTQATEKLPGTEVDWLRLPLVPGEVTLSIH